MVKCPVCGETYGVTHSCSGPPGVSPSVAAAWPVPNGFAPLRYFRQALAIARLDDNAIVAASLDAKSLSYGAAFWLIGQFLVFGLAAWVSDAHRRVIHWPVIIVGVFFLIMVDAVAVLAQYGICHLLARWWFDGRGTFVSILRPLLLGSIVAWLLVIPYIGKLVAGLWLLAVVMVVFENVEGIDRIKAFLLSYGVGLVFIVLFWSLIGLH